MGTRLFVGGLSFSTDDAALRAAFEPLGEVTDAKVIVDRESNRSRGFGFVTFANDSEAQEAIAKMDGAFVDGRTIRVNEAQDRARRDGPPRGRPDGPRSGPGARFGGGGAGRGAPPRGGGPDFVTRGRSAPQGDGPPAPNPASWAPPPEVDEAFQRDFEERPRRNRSKKPKKERDPERGAPRAPRSKNRRSSGRTWRDYDDLDE